MQVKLNPGQYLLIRHPKRDILIKEPHAYKLGANLDSVAVLDDKLNPFKILAGFTSLDVLDLPEVLDIINKEPNYPFLIDAVARNKSRKLLTKPYVAAIYPKYLKLMGGDTSSREAYLNHYNLYDEMNADPVAFCKKHFDYEL